MQVLIVGTGKLATELLNELSLEEQFEIVPWSKASPVKVQSILVHAGSGRELQEVIAYCRETRSVLIELATGSEWEASAPGFPVVVCPNTNILMLKFMNMLAKSGHLFNGGNVRVTESHQAGKTSTPGTAVAMAESLGLGAVDVVSVRDPEQQQSVLGIPPEHLGRHAFHCIAIEDAACSIVMETRVYGSSPYASGVAQIISAVRAHELESRVYAINEFIEKGWL